MEAEQHAGDLAAGSVTTTESRRRWPGVLANVLLSILLLGAVAPRPQRMGTPYANSYEIGRSLGLLIISLLIAYGIWRLFRRLRGSPSKWSPWVLLIAAFVAVILKAPATARDAADAGSDPPVSTEHIDPLSSEDIFVDIPGLRFAPLPEKVIERVEQSYLANGVPADAMSSVDGRTVFEGRRKVGVVTVVFATAETAAADGFGSGFVRGFTESIEEEGLGPVHVHDLSHGPARGGRLPQGYTISFRRENAGIVVLGGDRTTAEVIANGLLGTTD